MMFCSCSLRIKSHGSVVRVYNELVSFIGLHSTVMSFLCTFR